MEVGRKDMEYSMIESAEADIFVLLRFNKTTINRGVDLILN